MTYPLHDPTAQRSSLGAIFGKAGSAQSGGKVVVLAASRDVHDGIDIDRHSRFASTRIGDEEFGHRADDENDLVFERTEAPRHSFKHFEVGAHQRALEVV